MSPRIPQGNLQEEGTQELSNIARKNLARFRFPQGLPQAVAQDCPKDLGKKLKEDTQKFCHQILAKIPPRNLQAFPKGHPGNRPRPR